MLGRAVVVRHIDIWLVLPLGQQLSDVRIFLLPYVSMLCLREAAALGGQLSNAHDLLAPVVSWLVLDRNLAGVLLPAQLRDALSIALVVAPVALLHLSPAVAQLAPFLAPSLHLSHVVAPDVQGVQLDLELRVLPFYFFPNVLSL